MGAFQCWRLARAHHTIDIDKRFLAAVVAVSRQRVAQMRSKIHIIDEQDTDLCLAGFGHAVQNVLGDLVTRLGQNLAGFHIDEIIGKITANQIVICHEYPFDARFGKLAQQARGHLGAGRGHHLV